MKSGALFAAATALAIAGATAAAPAKPQRVMSLNLCTDQILLQLLPPERIASVTYLSRGPDTGWPAVDASRVAVNYGTSEEVLAQRPDLVVAGTTSTLATRALLREVGTPLLELPGAESFADIRKITRTIAHALGEDEKGEALLRRMDATLAELDRTAPAKPITVVAWDGGGNVPGPSTLFDAILTAAGAVNVATRLNQNTIYGNYSGFDLEQLVALNPELVIYGASGNGRRDQVHQQVQHRVVRKLFSGRQITYNETLFRCGLPQSADAAKQLRESMQRTLTAGEKSQ
jgi:iron complex transport system substrate-binding protein